MMFRLSNGKARCTGFARCAAVVCSVLLPTGFAEQVTLHLRNGDRLTGEFISLSTTNVVVINGVLGRLSVPVGYVERMEKLGATNLPPEAVKPSPPPPATVATSPARTNQVSTAVPPAAVSAASPIHTNGATAVATAKPAAPIAAAPPPPKPPKRWTVDVQFGTDLEFNQTQRELYYGRAKWTYGRDRFRAMLDYLANYGVYAGVVSANDMLGTARVEVDLTKAKKLYLFNAVGLG